MREALSLARIWPQVAMNRPGVDHRIEGAVVARIQFHGIECISARFDPHMGEHFIMSQRIKRHEKGKRLADRLDGERRIDVTH